MENENIGFSKLMRWCLTTADFEAAKTAGTVTDDVLVIVLQDKVAKFKGETFDWSGGADTSLLATKAELEEAEEVTAAALCDLDNRVTNLSENFPNDTVTKKEFNDAIESLTNAINGAIVKLTVEVDELKQSIANMPTQDAFNDIYNTIIENEEVTAAALCDLNKRIKQI